MRAGDETAGLDAIKKAFAKDSYNVRVFNTLNLYEKTIPNDYETGSDAVFKVRYPKEEKKVLERYLPKLLGEAWGSMKARYNYVPTVPVQVELYGSREQFSVRTSGLPNIGIQGVCFGRVLAAMSPKSESFNWGNVVWHELGHVFAIQLSKNHVPRWFTEGLSEYETIARRPEWQRELDPELYTALSKNALPSAVDMNKAFTHASDGLDVTVAYYAASQMLVFTVETYGMGKVTQALKLWGEGLRTPDVLQKAFGVSASEYDAKFRAWALAKLSRYKGQFLWKERAKPLDDAQKAAQAAPNDPNAHVALALALLHGRKLPDAKKEIGEALRLEPSHMPAHYLASKVADAEHDVQGQEQHLAAIQKAGGDGYQVQMALADLAEGKKDKAAMRAALEAASRFDPMQPDPLKGLFDLAKEQNRETDQIDILKKLAPLEQHDRKVWRMLLDKLVQAKRWDEAKKVGESTIFVDVESAGTHVAYARALGATGAHDKALFELQSAMACSPPAKEAATVQAVLAAEHLAMRNVAAAKKARDEALRLDPANSEAKALAIP
jgi:tetratricopeptide (TPR) repeat protein